MNDFEIPKQPPLTVVLLSKIQYWINRYSGIGGFRRSNLWQRLLRAESYLIARFNRDDSPEEADVLQLVWPARDVGGEGMVNQSGVCQLSHRPTTGELSLIRGNCR